MNHGWAEIHRVSAIGAVRPFRRRAHRFSPQAAPSRCRRAYAAPLILLAQTRQAERDKAWSDADARHREELSENTHPPPSKHGDNQAGPQAI